jgi:hypothetical protein
VRQRDIEVIVRSRLLADYGVHGPSTIDVDFQAILFQERNEVGGVLLNHHRSVNALHDESSACALDEVAQESRTLVDAGDNVSINSPA